MSASHPSPSLLDFARWFQIADPEGAVAEYIAKRGEFQRCRTCVGAGRLFCEQDRTCYDDSPPIAARSPAPSDEADIVTMHVVLEGVDRTTAIRIVENMLYHAKRGDTMEGMSPGYVCVRPPDGRSPNDPVDILRAARPAAPSVEARDADRESIAQTLWIGFGLHVEKLGFHNDPESALRAASLIAQYAALLPPETT